MLEAAARRVASREGARGRARAPWMGRLRVGLQITSYRPTGGGQASRCPRCTNPFEMDGSEALGVAEGLQRAADAEKAIILAEPRARHPISSFPPPQLLAATSDEQQLRDLKIQLLRSERERLSTHKRLNDLRKDLNSHEGANNIRHKELEQKMLGLLSDRPMSDAVRAAKQRVDEATFGMVAEQNALARVRRELAVVREVSF